MISNFLAISVLKLGVPKVLKMPKVMKTKNFKFS